MYSCIELYIEEYKNILYLDGPKKEKKLQTEYTRVGEHAARTSRACVALSHTRTHFHRLGGILSTRKC